MKDQDFNNIFIKHKIEIPDEGFSERVIKKLPERKSLLPKFIILSSIIIGLVIFFSIIEIAPLIEQINNLFASISKLQIPSLSSVFTSIGLLTMIGIISFSLLYADAE